MTEGVPSIETLKMKLWPPWSRRSQALMCRSALEKRGMGSDIAGVLPRSGGDIATGTRTDVETVACYLH